MKYLAVSLFGILLGAAAACVGLYYNPLTARQTRLNDGAGKALHYALPDDALRFAAGQRLLLPVKRQGEDSLWEETINRSALLAIVLRDDDGTPAAVATRLMAASSDTDLLLKGAIVNDYWLLTLPGEGTVFLHADTNLWPFLKNTLLPVWYLGRPWNGPTDLQPTMGPGPDGMGVALGGTGRFTSADGTAVESYTLTDLDPANGRVTASAELDLQGLEPVVATGE